MKETLREMVASLGHATVDCGAFSEAPSDYPDFAEAVGQAILKGEADRGILVCGSGIGACIAANKLPGIYAGNCGDTYSAHQGVEHDRMNVLVLGARIVGIEVAKEIVQRFLQAEFTPEERHIRRTAKIRELESRYTGCDDREKNA